MELFTIHTKILMPFVEETLKALGTMANLKAKALDATQEEIDSFSFQGYAVCVVANVYGEIEGKVLMHYHEETALLIGNKVMSNILGEEFTEGEINQEIGDALAEFSNTVIGRASRALGNSNLKITFEPPIFIGSSSETKSIMKDVVEILTIPILLEGSKHFCLSYLLHQDTNKS